MMTEKMEPRHEQEDVAKPQGRVPDYLREAANLYEANNSLFGYKQHGGIAMSLFPSGLLLKTKRDFSRAAIFFPMLLEFIRYANNRHSESLDGLAVYSMMLKELDSEPLEDAAAKGGHNGQA